MVRGQKIDDEIVVKIIEFYRAGNSARKTATKFGVGKSTVLGYNKPPEVKRQVEKEKSEKNVIAVRKRRRKVKQMAIDYMGGCCQVEGCGYNRCSTALEFHHKNPNEKDFGIGYKGYTRSWDKIKEELDKCVLVCSNCHREIHAGLIGC
jgi:ribosomal protein L30E